MTGLPAKPHNRRLVLEIEVPQFFVSQDDLDFAAAHNIEEDEELDAEMNCDDTVRLRAAEASLEAAREERSGLVDQIHAQAAEFFAIRADLEAARVALRDAEKVLLDHDCAEQYVEEGEPFSCDGCSVLGAIRALSAVDRQSEEQAETGDHGSAVLSESGESA